MTTEKESETLSLRLSKADKAMLDELVEAKRQELAPLGATTSLAQYVRGWIRSTHAAMKRQAAPAPTEAQVRRKLQASKRSQAELARLTGIDPGLLSRFRSGKKPLSPEKLARLAVELDR